MTYYKTHASRIRFILALIPAILIAVISSWDLRSKECWGDEVSSIMAASGQIRTFNYKSETLVFTDMYKRWIPDPQGPYTNKEFTSEAFWKNDRFTNIFKATIDIDRGNSLIYNIALHYWLKVVGVEDKKIQLLSILASSLAVFISFYLIFLITKSNLGAFVGALLFSIYPTFISASKEIRSYSFACLFLIASTYLLIRIYHTKSSEVGREKIFYYVIYMLCVSFAVFSHYNACFILISHLAFFLFARFWNWNGYQYLILSGLTLVILPFFLWMAYGGLEGIHVMSVHSLLWRQRAIDSNTLITDISGTFYPLWWNVSANLNNLYGQMISKEAFETFDFKERKLMNSFLVYVILVISVILAYFSSRKNFKLTFSVFILSIVGYFFFAVVSTLNAQHAIPLIVRYGVFAGIFYPCIIGILLGSSLKFSIFRQENFMAFVKYRFKTPRLNKALLLGTIKVSLVFLLIFSFVRSSLFFIPIVYKNQVKNPYSGAAKLMIEQKDKNGRFVFSSWEKANLVNVYLKNHNEIRQLVDESQKETLVFVTDSGKKIPIVPIPETEFN